MRTINRPLTLRPSAASVDRDMLAARALGFIAADEERLRRFLATTGADPAGLRAMAAAPGFAGAILEYLCCDEDLLVAFAEAEGLRPEVIARLGQSGQERPPRELN